MVQGKRFGFKLILETEVYFEAQDKLFYKKGIELLEKHWNPCITLEGDFVDELCQILPKSCFISLAWNLYILFHYIYFTYIVFFNFALIYIYIYIYI